MATKDVFQTLSWGANENGQLGVGDTVTRIRPNVCLSKLKHKQIACGSRFTMTLTAEGRIFTNGRGDDGQLGYDSKLQTRAQVIASLADTVIVGIATRGSHTLAVDDDGKVHAWGRSDDGQLGCEYPDDLPCCEPRVVTPLPSICIVACGRMFSLAVASSRSAIFAWGCGDDGSLGHGDYKSYNTPKKIENFPLRDKIVDVCCGSRHSLCQLSDGSAYTWGWGIYGQLGLGDRDNRCAPTLVTFPGHEAKLSAAASGRFLSNSFSAPESDTVPLKKQSSVVDDLLTNEAKPAAQTFSPISSLVMDRSNTDTAASHPPPHPVPTSQTRNTVTYGVVAEDEAPVSPRLRAMSGPAASSSEPTRYFDIPFFNYASLAVIKIAAGYRHCLCTLRQLTPEEIEALEKDEFSLLDDKFKATTANPAHAPDMIETFAWGWNQYGQLGLERGLRGLNGAGCFAKM